ncbi:MAG: copper homeostasis protein CutC [Gemmatimonadetes bacterium]|nr:copper homeostasis protein CutC [Gemmatimonadota bacterium]
MLIEVAVDTVPDAMAASTAGAGRIELCANLAEGGTTPSAGAMRATVARVDVPVFVMIRPRGGDFLYDAVEIDVMLRDIELAKQCGVHGVVSGALQPNGTIDEEGTEALIEAAAPLPFTFHRAFDLARNLSEALDTCLGLGVTRVLTSGGHATAMEGVDVLRELVRRTGGRMMVVAGGGVRAPHVPALATQTGVTELHLGPRQAVTSQMKMSGSVGAWREWRGLAVSEVTAAVAAARPLGSSSP